MNTSIRSIPAAALVFAFAALSARANADTFVDPGNVITLSAPTVRYLSNDSMTGAPVTETIVVARVRTDPVVLTLNSGVALFKDSVVEAARRACGADERRAQVDTACVRDALKEAKPQMDAIIAKARSASNG